MSVNVNQYYLDNLEEKLRLAIRNEESWKWHCEDMCDQVYELIEKYEKLLTICSEDFEFTYKNFIVELKALNWK